MLDSIEEKKALYEEIKDLLDGHDLDTWIDTLGPAMMYAIGQAASNPDEVYQLFGWFVKKLASACGKAANSLAQEEEEDDPLKEINPEEEQRH